MSEDYKALAKRLRTRDDQVWQTIDEDTLKAADAIERLTRERDELQARAERARLEADEAATRAERAEAALERDRTAVITACNKVCEEMAGRAWLLEGRGPYEWDDDRYRQEFSTALRAIEAPIEALRKIGRDWSNCPSDPQSISDAREDWKARAERAEAALRTIATGVEVRMPDGTTVMEDVEEPSKIAEAALAQKDAAP